MTCLLSLDRLVGVALFAAAVAGVLLLAAREASFINVHRGIAGLDIEDEDLEYRSTQSLSGPCSVKHWNPVLS